MKLWPLVAVIAVMVCNGAATADPEESPWREDYAEAKEEARKGGKPIFLVFR